jgi:hypothetical protein
MNKTLFSIGYHDYCESFRTGRGPRPDLKRKHGEDDDAYRARLREAIGSNNNFARETVGTVHGLCLDDFGRSIEHAIFIGWRGAAGSPRASHGNGCACYNVWEAKIREAKANIVRAEQAVKDAEQALADLDTAYAVAGRAELERRSK